MTTTTDASPDMPGPIVTPDTTTLWNDLRKAERRRDRIRAELAQADQAVEDCKASVAEYLKPK